MVVSTFTVQCRRYLKSTNLVVEKYLYSARTTFDDMTLSRAKLVDFGVLALRWYLAFYMLDYGWAKLTGDQFGTFNTAIASKPMNQVGKFHVAWYLFGLDKSFDIFIGLTQIIGGLLIIYNRTLLIGALILLPILAQIFIIDLAYTTDQFGYALPIRMASMLICDLLIMVYYRTRVIKALETLTHLTTTKFDYKWWVYILMPIVGFMMDFVFSILSSPIKLLLNWLL
jgi:uncharacterized membrane protein YphA (DoxX/SURF4 family)